MEFSLEKNAELFKVMVLSYLFPVLVNVFLSEKAA